MKRVLTLVLLACLAFSVHAEASRGDSRGGRGGRNDGKSKEKTEKRDVMKASVDTKAEAQKSKGMAISEKNEKLMEKNPAFKKMMENMQQAHADSMVIREKGIPHTDSKEDKENKRKDKEKKKAYKLDRERMLEETQAEVVNMTSGTADLAESLKLNYFKKQNDTKDANQNRQQQQNVMRRKKRLSKATGFHVRKVMRGIFKVDGLLSEEDFFDIVCMIGMVIAIALASLILPSFCPLSSRPSAVWVGFAAGVMLGTAMLRCVPATLGLFGGEVGNPMRLGLRRLHVMIPGEMVPPLQFLMGIVIAVILESLQGGRSRRHVHPCDIEEEGEAETGMLVLFASDMAGNFTSGVAMGVAFNGDWYAGIAVGSYALLHELPHALAEYVTYVHQGASSSTAFQMNFFSAFCRCWNCSGQGMGICREKGPSHFLLILLAPPFKFPKQCPYDSVVSG